MSQSQELTSNATVSRRFVLTLTSLMGLLGASGIAALSNFLSSRSERVDCRGTAKHSAVEGP